MRILILACLACLLPATALATPTPPVRITVTGQGVVSAMPDVATASFTISTLAPSAAAAVSQNDARYNALLRALHRMGVTDADIATTGYSLNDNPPPPPSPNPGSMPPQRQNYGYSVYRSISVTLRQPRLVGDTVDAAAKSGVTQIDGVSFGVSDTKRQRDLALRNAVEDGHRQAQAIATAAGLHILRIARMRVGAAMFQPRPMMAAAMMTKTVIQPTSVQTRARVTITYLAH